MGGGGGDVGSSVGGGAGRGSRVGGGMGVSVGGSGVGVFRSEGRSRFLSRGRMSEPHVSDKDSDSYDDELPLDFPVGDSKGRGVF